MATHSRILAWRIPWTEEPGGLQSMGSQRVRHDGAPRQTHDLTVLITHSSCVFHKHRGGGSSRNEPASNFCFPGLLNQQS